MSCFISFIVYDPFLYIYQVFFRGNLDLSIIFYDQLHRNICLYLMNLYNTTAKAVVDMSERRVADVH
jgi:hypothetical protein